MNAAFNHESFDPVTMPVAFHLTSSPASHSPARRWLGTRHYWLCQLICWGGLLVAWILPLLVRGNDIADDALYGAVFAGSGLGLSHLLRVAFLFHLRTARSWPATLLRLVPWVIAAFLAQSSIMLWTVGQLPQTASPVLYHIDQPGGSLFAYFDIITYCAPILIIWSGFYLAARSYRHYQDAELERLQLVAAAKDAELRSLQAQLNPHFLFNSLNTLRALIPRDLTAPREALTLLSDLLRAALTSGQEATIPFARELETVENYLALERLRFEERLAIRRTIDPSALVWPIPPFLLQTLVENAIKFGLNPREQGAEITLEATVSPAGLRVSVRNPGTLNATSASTGLGVKNARSHLRLLFGPAAALHLRQLSPEVVEAELLIPPLPVVLP